MEVKQLTKHYKKINGELWLVEDERENMKLDYRVKSIISSQRSPFQQVDIIDLYDFGKCLVLDGVIQSTVMDGYIYNEMISHIPVVTHTNPCNVLVIGGGDCGVVNELLKYEEIDTVGLVEIDEVVVRECVEHMPEIAGTATYDKRVNFIYEDGVKFVKDREDCYDVIIVDSSDPIGPAVQLFSEDFYKSIKNCLKKDGIMVCQSQSPIFHKEILKKTYNTLDKYFPIVRVYRAVVPSYPGGMWSFTIASLKYDPADADTERLVTNTKYVNREIFRSCFKLPNLVKKIIK